ncbi:unannotated protein [freshwater metagenome]|uniref:Unannotated protein n=1 Tax=freshwater metagenome TaxID=449393 RepID=A0A6J6CYP4_9ZZZZ
MRTIFSPREKTVIQPTLDLNERFASNSMFFMSGNYPAMKFEFDANPKLWRTLTRPSKRALEMNAESA